MILLAALAGLLRYIIPLFIPWGVKVIIDDILARPFTPSSVIKIHGLAGALLGLFVFWAILSFARLYFTGRVGNRVIFDLRHQLFLHLQGLSLDYFEKRKTGEILSRMTTDIASAQQLVGYGVIAALMDISSILVIAGILLMVHWKLAFVSFAVIPFYMVVSKLFSKKIRGTSREVQERMEHLMGNLQEKFAGRLF